MEKILEVKNLEVSLNNYDSKIKVVRGIDFELKKEETLIIVGESGCGKSMTAKSILQLLPKDKSEISIDSKIIFDNKDLSKLKEKELQQIRGKKISMIFQDPMTYLNPTMNIGEQVAESIIIHNKISKKEALEQAFELLKSVKISNPEIRMKQYPHELSGGMRQRVIIAIALACKPEILIADEPTTALDVTTQADIMELIEELKVELGMSIILITHDLGIALEMGDRIQVMYAGEIVETGTRKDIFENSKHPYTWALLKSVPSLNSKQKELLYAIDGMPPDLSIEFEGCMFASRCKHCMSICKKQKPEIEKYTDTHHIKCWLSHPLANCSGGV